MHRDLNLENILLSIDDCGEVFDIKVSGFGKALRFSKGADGDGARDTGALQLHCKSLSSEDHKLSRLCGTAGFKAPEVILQHPYDEKVDVWQLGVILYALVTGSLPFCEKDDNLAQIKTVLEDPTYTSSKGWNRVSGQAKSLTQQMLSKEAYQRPKVSEILNHPWLCDKEIQKRGMKQIQKPSS